MGREKANADPSLIPRAYREPGEPPDERPVIVYRSHWRDESERLTYEHAVETNPRKPDESPLEYIRRISSVAQGRLAGPAVRPMPQVQPEDVRLPYRDRE